MRRVLLLAVAVSLGLSAVARAASSPESLWLSGAQFEKKLSLSKSLPGDPPDPAVVLKAAKRGLDRAYRLDMDYKMLLNTVAETQAELDKFASDPQPAQRDRIENLLKFLADAMPVEGDRMDAVLNSVQYLYFELPAKPDAELVKAVRDLDAYIGRDDQAVEAFAAAAAKLQARTTELEASLGGRAPWLAAKLTEDADQGVKFFDFVKEQSAKVVAKLGSAK